MILFRKNRTDRPLEVIGKRNKYREVPLNATARQALEGYLSTLPAQAVFLFPSGVTVLTLVVAIANGRSHERRDDDNVCVPNTPVENTLGRVWSIW